MEEKKEGILLINKIEGKTSFDFVYFARKILGIKTIGHAGTLDPFATGVLVLLIGKTYTKKSASFLNCSKVYESTFFLGSATDTYDREGVVTDTSSYIPTLKEIEEKLACFQGDILQKAPPYSAKKVNGKKLCDLARKGIEVSPPSQTISVKTTLLSYEYPFLKVKVEASKGTYIRSIADDLGKMLGCFGHAHSLVRTQSGSFSLDNCIDGALLANRTIDKETLSKYLVS